MSFSRASTGLAMPDLKGEPRLIAIRGVVRLRFKSPFRQVQRRKKRVAVLHDRMDSGQVNDRGTRQGEAVNLLTPADKRQRIFARRCERGIEVVDDGDVVVGGVIAIAGEDDIVPFGQGAEEGFECGTAHDNGVAGRGVFEKFQVGREVPGQVTVASDDMIGRRRGDHGEGALDDFGSRILDFGLRHGKHVSRSGGDPGATPVG